MQLVLPVKEGKAPTELSSGQTGFSPEETALWSLPSGQNGISPDGII